MSSGSPMPISTKEEMGSPACRSASYTSPSISAGVRLRTSPPRVEAQNLQPIRQPTWVEMQRLKPCSYRIRTASTQLRSGNSSSSFTVSSSRLSSRRRVVRVVRKAVSSSFCRRAAERLVISPKEPTRFWWTHR